MSGHAKVMLVMPREGIYRGILLGFSRIALQEDWVLSMQGLRPETSPMSIAIQVQDWKPDVMVLSPGWLELIPEALRQGRIVVGAEADLTEHGFASIVADNGAVGAEAARHLLQRGFRSLAPYGLGHLRFAVERAESFTRTAVEGGARCARWSDAELLPMSSTDWFHGTADWLLRLPKPLGILCCCDVWASHLMQELRRLRLRVPEDVAVVGVDNDELACALTRPAMSSVVVPWEKLGTEVALLVDRLLKGEPAPPEPIRIMPQGVAVRRSSDTIAVDDPAVAEALAMIRRNASRPIGVPEIVRQVAVSRRTLEQRFRRAIGRSIMEEVRRVHVELARQYLGTGDMTINQIAERSGFTDRKQLAKAFADEVGQTPRQYRRGVNGNGH